MTGHTPGPWTIYAETHVMVGDRLVAGCGGHSSNVDHDKIRAENAANARLIAAAPAMLEALKAARQLFGMEPCDATAYLPQVEKQVAAAIAAAETEADK